MHALSQTILQDYQVRMKKAQKTAFIELLQKELPQQVTVETGGTFHSRNLIIGDLDHCKYILAAHYDTASVLPFPNLLFPKNIPAYIGFCLLICIVFFVLMTALDILALQIVDHPLTISFVSLLLVVLLFGWVLFGKPNRHTANDNTSGVLTAIEALHDPALKDNICVVLFDHEEMGLFGSAAFAKKHKQLLKDKLLFNLDCVGDGDHIMLILSKQAQAQQDAITAAFSPENDKTVLVEKSSHVLYPSDQSNFKNAVGVAAFNRHKLFGLYLDKIHTGKDTVCDENNITLLLHGFRRLTAQNDR